MLVYQMFFFFTKNYDDSYTLIHIIFMIVIFLLSYSISIFLYMMNGGYQWPFQDPKLEVPTIYKVKSKAYVREYYPQKIWPYMVQYLHFRVLKFPLIKWPTLYVVGKTMS